MVPKIKNSNNKSLLQLFNIKQKNMKVHLSYVQIILIEEKKKRILWISRMEVNLKTIIYEV